MTELERLREENAALRRALLRLCGTCHTAVAMVEHRYPDPDVVRHLEDGADAAARDMPDLVVSQ